MTCQAIFTFSHIMDNPYFWPPLLAFLSGLSLGLLVRFVLSAFTMFLGPRPSVL